MTKETDRELLEYAAKAAGIDYIISGGQLWTTMEGSINKHTERLNPLANDGQALRLAVSCSLEIYHAENDGVMVCVAGYAAHDGRIRYVIEPHGDDKHAATRRAIVRAAAQIEKAMK